MSGLEVVAVVASIVSAYGAASTLYGEWRRRKRKRKQESANKKLKQLMKTGGAEVREEYDRNFRRLGRAFEKGDEIGRTALMEQLITLQHTVIALLSDKHAGDAVGAAVHPNHTRIHETSYAVQQESLVALGQLYQRLSVAAPITRLASRDSTSTDSYETRKVASSARSRQTPTNTRRGSTEDKPRYGSALTGTRQSKAGSPTQANFDPPITTSIETSKRQSKAGSQTEANSNPDTTIPRSRNENSNCGQKVITAGPFYTLGCQTCGWLLDHTIPLISCKIGGLTVCKKCWCQKFHFSPSNGEDGWRCWICLCQKYSIRDLGTLNQHLIYNHSYLQAFPNRCENGDPGCGR